MTNKLEAVQEKYHTAKTMTTIKNYFLTNTSEEVWNELEENINKGYLVIPNITAWYQDFILGGGDTAKMAPLLLEPFTHTIDLEKFNAYGNVAFGDMLSMLRCCMDFNMKDIEVLDFGAALMILAAMVTSITSKKNKCKHREAESGLIFDISKEVDWLARSAVALFTSPSNVAHTNFTFHIPSMYDSLRYANLVLKTIRPYMKLLKIDLTLTPEVYQGLAVGSYFMFASGLNLRDNFEKPSLVFHEMELTKAQYALVSAESLKDKDVISSIRTLGIENAFRVHMRDLSIDEYKGIEKALVSEDKDEVMLYLPNQNASYTHQVITTRKRLPEGMSIVRENPCETTLELEEVPIATCTIDVDKILAENSTKSEEWLINHISALYSNAQDINRLRASLQTNADGKKMFVNIKVNNKDFKDKLLPALRKITVILINTFDDNMCFRIVEGK